MKIALAVLAFLYPVSALSQLSDSLIREIGRGIDSTLTATGTPSVSLALVVDGKIVLVRAYGDGRVEPKTPAKPEMRYGIGSISKQILAGALLILQEEGKLSIDDRVSKYLPALTRASDITIKQLLSHTSGYEDYYPLDYVAPFMLQPVTADEIIERWARVPLDFEPGTQWQYSNTGFVVAGRILEKASGVPVAEFLRSRIFVPLRMTSVMDLDRQQLTGTDAQGCIRFGLGPPRPAHREGQGWLFAAGELAMTADDLALWDISLMEHTLLTPASLDLMMTPLRLKNGAPLTYALGVGIRNRNGHPVMQHAGAIAGFAARNTVWPDQGSAIVVLSNKENSSAPASITDYITGLLFDEQSNARDSIALLQAKAIFAGLQKGTIDRSLLTADAQAYFTPQVLADYGNSLGPLGVPSSFKQTGSGSRGGYHFRNFHVTFSKKNLELITYAEPGGKLAQCLVTD